jgi:2'-5' RNA ligase
VKLWLALAPDVASAAGLAQPGGETPERLHSTLAFFGERDEADTQRLRACVRVLAGLQGPFTASFGADRVFGPPADAVRAVELQSDVLHHLRALLELALPARLQPDSRWPYAPHLTLGPVALEPGPLPQTIQFDRLLLVHGDQHEQILLRG